ncbi:U4/U6-U5 snRNP complex subunit lsm8 [Lathyrus oleraceus]|uniref:galactinol--sucrose galactosyltransferase n=1 Tax=Pisum sativum TaxID=3888 RepID=A0A9D4ZWA3_PEA|nr:U4/U6-U5 snRNP complex subunit lsm8 [Pisum sativum]
MSAGPGLESLVDQTISVITNDGRNIVGVLKGFDQATNIILDESHERVYSTKEGVQQLVLGLYIIRGDNISVVGELDEDLDSNLDLSKLRAHPLKPGSMLFKYVLGSIFVRYFIIDDGWQQIESKPKDADSVVQEGAQFATRLTGIKENTKFQKNGGGNGLEHVVDQTKQLHNMKYVYVWHALAGYWGGVKPTAIGMEHFNTVVAYPIHSPGVLGNQPDAVMDSLTVHGLDGVKVDVQNIIETLGSGHGGRVSITRSYHQALEASIARNFCDNGCISCMCHNTDGLYSAKQTAVVRASDDFYPHDPASHTIHVSSVTYNSIFLGEFMQPDWDMFHSLHPAAEYHAAARAISGGPIYIEKKNRIHCETPETLTGSVCTSDVDLIAQVAGADWNGDAVVFSYRSGNIALLPKGASMPVTLKVLEYELFHFYPIKEIAQGIWFAPIGLLDMFNTGGAVEQFEIHQKGVAASVSLKVRGSGRFGVYCSQRPVKCVVGDNENEFKYESETGLTTF